MYILTARCGAYLDVVFHLLCPKSIGWALYVNSNVANYIGPYGLHIDTLSRTLMDEILSILGLGLALPSGKIGYMKGCFTRFYLV